MSGPAIACAQPSSLAAALASRSEHTDWLVLAGGTDVMVARRELGDRPGVLDLFGVGELHRVERAGDTIRIGACATYAELLAGADLRDELPLLWRAAGEVGAEQVRQRGTIGGNIVTCSPVGDMLPGLLALDASVVIASTGASRTVPYEELVCGYREVDLRPDELLVGVEVPIPAAGTVQHWRKVGTRAAQAITKVSIAAVARVEQARVAHVRLAFGAVADRPVRLRAVEALVEGASVDEALVAAVERAVRDSLQPITDVRSTADYRAGVAGRLAARFVADLAAAPTG